jgi:H+/gluconate symporter-like permease
VGVTLNKRTSQIEGAPIPIIIIVLQHYQQLKYKRNKTKQNKTKRKQNKSKNQTKKQKQNKTNMCVPVGSHFFNT